MFQMIKFLTLALWVVVMYQARIDQFEGIGKVAMVVSIVLTFAVLFVHFEPKKIFHLTEREKNES